MTELKLTPELIDTFLEEVGGYLSTLEDWLFSEPRRDSADDLRKIVETAHSLKGVTGMIGRKDMHEVAAVLHGELKTLEEEPAALADFESRIRDHLARFAMHFETFQEMQNDTDIDFSISPETCGITTPNDLPSCEEWRDELDDIEGLADQLRSGWDSERLIQARDSVRRLLQCENLPETCVTVFSLHEKTVCWMIADAQHFSQEAVEFLNLLAVSIQEICEEVHSGNNGRVPLENFLSMAAIVAPADLRETVSEYRQNFSTIEDSPENETNFLIGLEESFSSSETGSEEKSSDGELSPGGDEDENLLEGLGEIFREEGREQLKQLRNLLDNMQPASASDEEINAIFRIVHTLKGSAAMVGKNELSKIIHDLEDILDEVREGNREMSDLLLDGLYNSLDLLSPFVHQDFTKEQERDSLADFAAVVKELCEQLPEGKPVSSKPEPPMPDIEIKTPALEKSVSVELASLEHIMDMVSELRTAKVRIREFVSSGVFGHHQNS